MNEVLDLLVKRGEPGATRITSSPVTPLATGEVRLRVDLFSLTANNVTYAAYGEALRYWAFFPAPEGWGRVPVWGFATVTDSRSQNLSPGDRVYGYLPMSTEFAIHPGAPRHGGVVDQSEHRAGLPAVYNSYVLNTADELYTADTEPLQVLFRPLFTTSFLIDDFIDDNALFGASQVIFSSASAKTAYCAAQLLRMRKVRVVGLTSPSSLAFARQLGCYDDVVPYSAIDELSPAPSVFVDIAGNARVRAHVHAAFGDNLKYSCTVGATHWDAPRSDVPVPGPQPQMFFAPSVIQKRVADWGGAVFQQRVRDAWRAFLPAASRQTRLIEGRTLDDAARAFTDLALGRAHPGDGHIIRMSGQ